MTWLRDRCEDESVSSWVRSVGQSVSRSINRLLLFREWRTESKSRRRLGENVENAAVAELVWKCAAGLDVIPEAILLLLLLLLLLLKN